MTGNAAPGGAGPAEGPAHLGRCLEELERWAHACFDRAQGSHDWEHTRRVLALCRHIGRAEKADAVVLHAAACLHDIGRARQDQSGGQICHARQGVEMARPVVAVLPVSRKRRDNILHCIAAHRFRGTQTPRTREARVLFDADKLDAIGAVGIARAFLFAGEVGARLHNADGRISGTSAYTRDDTGYREYKLKLSKIHERMLTRTGREMAAARHVFMAAFFERFEAEHRGEA